MIIESELKDPMLLLNKLTAQLNKGDSVMFTLKDKATGELIPLVLEHHHVFVKAELQQRNEISVNLEL